MKTDRVVRMALNSAGLILLTSSLTGCVESSFKLASDSKLPKSVSIPPGLTRADLFVTLNLYSSLGADAKFIVSDAKHHKLQEVKGKTRASSDPMILEIVTKDRVKEIVRLIPYAGHHHMEVNGTREALFDVVDDEKLAPNQ